MPGAGPMMRTDFRKLYHERLPYLRELIGCDSWPEADSIWEQFFQVMSSDKMREEFLEYAGFGLFKEMSTENEAVTYDQMLQGPSKVFTHLLYGLGFQTSFLVGLHDLDGIIKKCGPELGRAMRVSVQTLAASFWNGAFATSKTADGQYYFSASHTFIRGGGTFSNMSSTAASLGQTALEAGIVTFGKMQNLDGTPMPLPLEKLVIPPDLEPIAYELTQSRLRSDSTTNVSSFVYNRVKPVVWPFLTSSTAWMLLSPKEYTKVYWFWNKRPMTNSGYDFDKEAAKTKTLFACSFGAVDPRGSYGSAGA